MRLFELLRSFLGLVGLLSFTACKVVCSNSNYASTAMHLLLFLTLPLETLFRQGILTRGSELILSSLVLFDLLAPCLTSHLHQKGRFKLIL